MNTVGRDLLKGRAPPRFIARVGCQVLGAPADELAGV